MSLSPHTLALHPLHVELLANSHLPPMRKSGFPYFTKLSPRMPKGTKPANAANAAKRKPQKVQRLTASELDALLE